MACEDPGSTKCAGTWTASAAEVMALSESFFLASCSWQLEGLFGLSFSVALNVQAHRGRTFFACGSSAPVRVEGEAGAAVWLAGTLAAPSVQGNGLPLPLELWPYQSLFFDPLVAGDQKVSLASLSL